MIEIFLHSIAGKKPRKEIDSLLQEFLTSQFTPVTIKRVLQHTIEVSSEGNYPSEDYYKTFYGEPTVIYNTIAEIKTYCKKAQDYYRQQYIQQNAIEAINEATSSKDLQHRLMAVADLAPEPTDELDVKPKLFSKLREHLTKGVLMGIKELDEITYGLQPGTVASFAGFVAHGKTTLTDSVLFKNALEGKKCILLSLEMSEDLLWPQFEARYMNQVKGIQVTAQDFIHNKVPSDIMPQVEDAEKDFLEEFACNLAIIDESYINKQMMLNYKSFSMLVDALAIKLGGLDIIAFDHVTQFELMFKDCGNQIIKTIQSFTKTYTDQRGIRPVSIMAVQVNRQGEMRARKRNGVYDLQAISDLNEVERTSTYCIFIYTSEDMKIMQETKITMPKHRLGAVTTEPIVTTFNPAIITVGQSVESVEMSDDDFNDLDLDLGGGFDDFS